jgi:hypothetical protein
VEVHTNKEKREIFGLGTRFAEAKAKRIVLSAHFADSKVKHSKGQWNFLF